MPIGQFARVAGISVRTLRFYDEAEVLRPVEVDPNTGYRRYGTDQIETARRIARLRAMDFPLEEIRGVLAAQTESEVRTILERHRQRLTSRIERDGESIRLLDGFLLAKENPMHYPVQIKEVAAIPALVVRTHIDRPEDSGPAIVHAFTKELWPYVDGERFAVTHPYFVECVDLEGEGGPADLTMAIPMEEEAPGKGSIERAVIPGGRFASTIHEGPYPEMGAAYRAVVAWIEAQDLELAGASREVYLVDYRATKDDQALRTEIMIGIR